MRHGFGSMSSIPVTGASKTEAPLECNYIGGGVRPQILFGGGWEDNWRIVGYTETMGPRGGGGGGRQVYTVYTTVNIQF